MATSGVSYFNLFKDIGNVCLTQNHCGTCQEKHCLIGYAKESVAECRKADVTYVKDGFSNIPYTDTKGSYDEEHVLTGIAHVLKQCRSCKENHYNDCVLNVVRSCYETILFGESQPFNGSAFAYLMKLQEKDPNRAAIVLDEYKKEEI